MITPDTKIYKTPDRDLVQLSGYSVYKHPTLTSRVRLMKINNRRYFLINTNFGHLKSGLDAMVIQDEATKNISIIYAGTDPNQPADISTDAGPVLSSGTPQR